MWTRISDINQSLVLNNYCLHQQHSACQHREKSHELSSSTTAQWGKSSVQAVQLGESFPDYQTVLSQGRDTWKNTALDCLYCVLPYVSILNAHSPVITHQLAQFSALSGHFHWASSICHKWAHQNGTQHLRHICKISYSSDYYTTITKYFRHDLTTYWETLHFIFYRVECLLGKQKLHNNGKGKQSSQTSWILLLIRNVQLKR